MVFSNGRDERILLGVSFWSVYILPPAGVWSTVYLVLCCIAYFMPFIPPVLSEFKASHLQPSSLASSRVVLKGIPLGLKYVCFPFFPAWLRQDQYLSHRHQRHICSVWYQRDVQPQAAPVGREWEIAFPGLFVLSIHLKYVSVLNSIKRILWKSVWPSSLGVLSIIANSKLCIAETWERWLCLFRETNCPKALL